MKRQTIFTLGLSLFLFAGLWNIGFIATDDYTNGIEIMIPAQVERSPYSIATYTHNPPTPRLLMFFLAKVALRLGVDSPANQVRFVYALIGVFGFIVTFFSIGRIFDLYQDEKKDFRKTLALALFSFYFLCPLFSSRALVESFALPYLTASAALASTYYKERRLSQGVLALMVIALGSIMRYQLGICAAVIFAIPLFIRRPKHLLSLSAVAVALFGLTGAYDAVLTGSFHGSLKSYFFYNLYSAGADFGHQPFYVFFLLFIGLSLPPTFLRSWKGFSWRTAFQPLMVVLAYFTLFVLLHSLSPHKEERFMIPVLPLFLMLLVPLLLELWEKRCVKRLAYFGALNFLLLILTTVEIPQKNIVFLMTFLDQHPSITHLAGVKDTLVIYPGAFLRKPVRLVEVGELTSERLNCETAIAAREDLKPHLPSLAENLEPVQTFRPGLLEGLVVKLNPKYNQRRAAITLYMKRGCLPT